MFHYFLYLKQHAKETLHEKGFSLLEMIVALSIFTLLSTVLLMNYNTFNARINLETLASEVGQWVRDAQVSAMSVRNAGGSSGFVGYGLHFDKATPDRFVLFADRFPVNPKPNQKYDPPVGTEKCGDITTECVKEVLLLKGNTISSLKGEMGGNLIASNSFDVMFLRPNPDAIIKGDPVGSVDIYGRAEITLKSPANNQRTVIVYTTGQITVQ